MPDITIPPAALQAGRKELKVYFSGYQDYAVQEIARAAFVAMVKAWPGMEEVDWYHADKSIILPLTEKTDGE